MTLLKIIYMANPPSSPRSRAMYSILSQQYSRVEGLGFRSNVLYSIPGILSLALPKMEHASVLYPLVLLLFLPTREPSGFICEEVELGFRV
jgi:hypothetical protein